MTPSGHFSCKEDRERQNHAVTALAACGPVEIGGPLEEQTAHGQPVSSGCHCEDQGLKHRERSQLVLQILGAAERKRGASSVGLECLLQAQCRSEGKHEASSMQLSVVCPTPFPKSRPPACSKWLRPLLKSKPCTHVVHSFTPGRSLSGMLELKTEPIFWPREENDP